MKRHELIIAQRDPTPKDMIHCIIWWNKEKNRFFQIIDIGNEFHWEQIKEII
jgi:hypothetical protein